MAPRRKTLSDIGVAELKPKTKRYAHPDPEQRGHYIRVQPSGAKTYVVVARDPGGKQVWQTVGDVGVLDIAAAREKAREIIKAIVEGTDRAGPQSYRKVSDEWFKRHVERKDRRLRSAPNIRCYLDRHILPAWKDRDFKSIKRSDLAKLLDHIEDTAGAVAADQVLSVVSSISNWYAARDDNYMSPVVRGMRRSQPKERARDRILNDDEIRAVWAAAEANGTFGAFIRVALLTGQRKDKVISMKWEDLDGDVWRIPSEEREKGNAGDLELPADSDRHHQEAASIRVEPARLRRPRRCTLEFASPRARLRSTGRCRFRTGQSMICAGRLGLCCRVPASAPSMPSASSDTSSVALKGSMTGTATAKRRPRRCVRWPA